MRSEMQGIDWSFCVDTSGSLGHALSLPLGVVVISDELLDIMSEDQVAFVIAHEMGHQMARHAGESVTRCYSLQWQYLTSSLLAVLQKNDVSECLLL
jgi:Zn-dependent protease with chaperone function